MALVRTVSHLKFLFSGTEVGPAVLEWRCRRHHQTQVPPIYRARSSEGQCGPRTGAADARAQNHPSGGARRATSCITLTVVHHTSHPPRWRSVPCAHVEDGSGMEFGLSAACTERQGGFDKHYVGTRKRRNIAVCLVQFHLSN